MMNKGIIACLIILKGQIQDLKLKTEKLPHVSQVLCYKWFPFWVISLNTWAVQIFFFSSWEYWFAGRSPKFIHLFLGGQWYSSTEGSRLGSWMPIFLFRVGSVFIGGKLNIAWKTSAYIHYKTYFFPHCPLDHINISMHLKRNVVWFL